MRPSLERRLLRAAKKISGRIAMRDQALVQLEARVRLALLHRQLLQEHGIDPDDPDADQRLREIEPGESPPAAL